MRPAGAALPASSSRRPAGPHHPFDQGAFTDEAQDDGPNATRGPTTSI